MQRERSGRLSGKYGQNNMKISYEISILEIGGKWGYILYRLTQESSLLVRRRKIEDGSDYTTEAEAFNAGTFELKRITGKTFQ